MYECMTLYMVNNKKNLKKKKKKKKKEFVSLLSYYMGYVYKQNIQYISMGIYMGV